MLLSIIVVAPLAIVWDAKTKLLFVHVPKAAGSQATLTDEFKEAVANLPSSFNGSRADAAMYPDSGYMALIERFGTHFVPALTLGASFGTRSWFTLR